MLVIGDVDRSYGSVLLWIDACDRSCGSVLVTERERDGYREIDREGESGYRKIEEKEQQIRKYGGERERERERAYKNG